MYTSVKHLDNLVQDSKNTKQNQKRHLKQPTLERKRKHPYRETKSTITDHVSEQNHVIGWDKAKIKERGQNKRRRLIKESICIRKHWPGAKTLNRDDRNYLLRIYDQLLLLTAPPTSSVKRKEWKYKLVSQFEKVMSLITKLSLQICMFNNVNLDYFFPMVL